MKDILTFDEMVDYFINSINNSPYKKINKNSLISYQSYLNGLNKANGGKTAQWISEIIKGKTIDDPVEEAIKKFESFFNNYTGKSQSTIDNWKTAYKSLSESIIGLFYGNVWAFYNNRQKYDEYLCQTVAQNALFPSKEIVEDVIHGKLGTQKNISLGGNPYASWDHMEHVRVTGTKKGTSITTYGFQCKADDNTSANHYIKQAILRSLNLKSCSFDCFHDYEACHVWDKPDDPRYYASIANLILLPRAFGQLTDHCNAVKELLRYEVFKRFGFKPDSERVPSKPDFYDKIVWRIKCD